MQEVLTLRQMSSSDVSIRDKSRATWLANSFLIEPLERLHVDRDDRIEQLVEVRCVASGSGDRKRLEQPLVGDVVRKSCPRRGEGGVCVGRRGRPRLEARTVLSAPTAVCHAAVGSRSRGARRFEQGLGSDPSIRPG